MILDLKLIFTSTFDLGAEVNTRSCSRHDAYDRVKKDRRGQHLETLPFFHRDFTLLQNLTHGKDYLTEVTKSACWQYFISSGFNQSIQYVEICATFMSGQWAVEFTEREIKRLQSKLQTITTSTSPLRRRDELPSKFSGVFAFLGSLVKKHIQQSSLAFVLLSIILYSHRCCASRGPPPIYHAFYHCSSHDNLATTLIESSKSPSQTLAMLPRCHDSESCWSMHK